MDGNKGIYVVCNESQRKTEENGISTECIVEKLIKHYGLNEAEAKERIEKYQ